MKFIFTAFAVVVVLCSSSFARRGNPTASSSPNIQYYVIDSDDDHSRRPTYSFTDTTFGTWTRVTGFTNPDTGNAQITSGSALDFTHYTRTIQLPPRYVHVNGFVSFDVIPAGTMLDTIFQRASGAPSAPLPANPFTSVYPLWCDIEHRSDSSKVLYRVTSDSCLVNFYNMFLKGTNGKVRATFQVVFSRLDSSITMNYRSFDGSFGGESAASLFQRFATIGVQDTLGVRSTMYLARNVFRAANLSGTQYEKDLHNNLSVKFLRAAPNSLRLVSIDEPPFNGYEVASESFAPTVTLANLTDSVRKVAIIITMTNRVTGTQVYGRTDTIASVQPGERQYTGATTSAIGCGVFRMTATVSTAPTYSDAWTYDNTLTRDFVLLNTMSFPVLEDFITLNTCRWNSIGAEFFGNTEDVMYDASAPRSTGSVVLDRANARDIPYIGTSVGDTLTSAPMNLANRTNVWLSFNYQRSIRSDSIQAGIRNRTLSGPEARFTQTSGVIEGDSLLVEAIIVSAPTFNPQENHWQTIGKIYGGIDTRANKYRLQLPSNILHNHSRIRLRLAAKNNAPTLGAPLDDLDAYVIDNIQISSPQITSGAETDLEVLGFELGNENWTHIPRDARSLHPVVTVSSNGLQATQAVYQVRVILRDNLSREVYHRTESLTAPQPRTTVSLRMPEWIIDGSQSGTFTARVTIEQMFSDYHKRNDTNTFFRTLIIGDVYAYDDSKPDTAGTMTVAENSSFYHNFSPIKSDSLRGFDFFHVTANGNTSWEFTIRKPNGTTSYTRSSSYDVTERGFHRASFAPVYLSRDTMYEIHFEMTQGFGLGGDGSHSLVLRSRIDSLGRTIYSSVFDSLARSFKDENRTAYFPTTGLAKNGSGGGALIPMMRLVFAGSSTYLPVELVKFSGKRVSDNTVTLFFHTAQEKNARYFTIDREEDAGWQTIRTVTATNSSHGAKYSALDDDAPQASLTYRLTEHALDGAQEVLGLVTVGSVVSEETLSLHPNPASNIVRVALDIHHGPVTIGICNELGIEVQRFEGVTADALDIDVSRLPNGMYYVEKTSPGGIFRTKLFVHHN